MVNLSLVEFSLDILNKDNKMAMKLTRHQIETISALILMRLKEQREMTMKADEETILAAIRGAITEDIAAENSLDLEVQKMMKEHEKSMNAERMDERKVFNMIKAKLVRERDIIL